MMTGDLVSLKKCVAFIALMAYALSTVAVSLSDEEQVGEAAAAKILGAAKLIDNQSLQDYVNTLGASLSALTDRSGLSWKYAVIDSPNVNAFAAPGGIILITRGLLKMLDTEDELAAVICHEIGHVVGKHHYKIVLRQRLTEDATKQMATIYTDKELSALSNLSSVFYARGLDKGAEFDADIFAVQLLGKAGYDASAMIGVFEKLGRMQTGDSRAELLFSTHPLPLERLDQLSRANLDALPAPTLTDKRKSRFQNAKASL